MTEHVDARELAAQDRQVVDLLTAVLVDPNLHTDTRMRIHREITALLQRTREEFQGSAGHEAHERSLAVQSDHLPSLVEAVLVANVHTDVRMRLHREIPALLRRAVGRLDVDCPTRPTIETTTEIAPSA